MLRILQRWIWEPILLRKCVDARVISQRLKGLPPPELIMATQNEVCQWKEGLLIDLTSKVSQAINAAQHLIKINIAPKALVLSDAADTCHFHGWRQGFWDSTGIHNQDELATSLRTTAHDGFDVALQIDPNEKGALYGKGEILFTEGRFTEASVNFNRLLELGVDATSEQSVSFYLSVCNGSQQLSSVLTDLKNSGIGSLDFRVPTHLLKMN